MKEQTYVVTFIGTYFSMRVTVVSITDDHDVVVAQASALIEEQYGWDLDATDSIYFDTEVEQS